MENKRLWFIAIVVLLCSLTASAHDFEVDGIYYQILSDERDNYTVEVTYRGSNPESYSNEYSGVVMIPSTITISDGRTFRVIGIGHSAFKDCSNLSFINFPNEITTIGDYAFQNCKALTYLTIPERVQSIGELTFDGCSELFTVLFPESLKSIGDFAFRDCSKLYTIELPDSVTYIGKSAFLRSGWYNIQPYGIVYAGKNLYSYKGTMPKNTSVEVKDGTISISPYAFSGCTELTSISIPKSIKSIGENAFRGTTWYDNQPDGVVYLSQILYAYKGTMPENTSIEIKDGTVGITEGVFTECENLVSITIPDGVVTGVGDYAFQGCKNLSTVSIGNSVEYIGDYAFYNCYSLSTLTIGDNVKNIGNNAFEYCYNLQTVAIPNSVVKIGESVFQNCSNLTSVIIGDSLIGISNNAFKSCHKLTSAILGSALTYIGDYAFNCCDSLNEIVITNSVTEIGKSAFGGCDNLSSVDFGDSLMYIGKDAFYGCKKISSIEIPELIQRIDCDAFDYCTGLKTVIFRKKSAFVIESVAFNGCTNLTDVYLNATSFSNYFLGIGAFPTTVTKNATLHVPKSGLAWFQKADVWKTFGNIVPLPILTYIVDGVEYKIEEVIPGDSIVTNDPIKEGYIFSGWSELPATMPAEDVTVVGTFTINKYLATFKVDDEVILSDSLEYGATIVTPEVPNKEGYSFDGWEDIPNSMPAHDLTISGRFIANVYKVYYYVGEELLHTAEVTYGETIPEYIYEPEEGYIYHGWIGDTYETMPAHDVTYMANIESGITNLNIDNGELIIYNLDGHKITDIKNLNSGIYIINGRKVLLK